MYEFILFESGDGIATITLNRPEKLNAYTLGMGDEVVDAFSRVRDDADVRAVILTGAGRGFCSGVDLDELKKSLSDGAPEGRGGKKLGEEDFLAVLPLELIAYPKPVIAAINGPAIGVGVTMTLPCDIRIAADTAKLGLTFTKLGLLPGLGSTHLLPKIVGMAKALELVLTARVISAEEAREIGLVNAVVPADALAKTAREMAGLAAACDPNALAAAKRALHFGAGASMEEAMRNERSAGTRLRENRKSGKDR